MFALLIALLAPPTEPPPAAPATTVITVPGVLPGPPEGGIILAGTLERSVVQAVVKAGPQPFIAGVQVAPVMEAGRFRGFRLLEVKATSPLAGSENVRAGDVLVSVNGLPVERPDQFMAAWGKLARAERLEVKLLRGEQPLTYRWTIQP